MTRVPWTMPELAVLRQHYPIGGINVCQTYLPHRTRSSIYQHANALGLRAPGGKVEVRQSYPQDDAVDLAIRRAHQQPLLKGAVTDLAERVDRPTWWVSKRARELGLKTPRFREAPWSDAEQTMLHDTCHLSLGAARRRFIAAGFNRSETAIQVKRKRSSVNPQDNGMYTGRGVGDALGVDIKTVTRWIGLGELKAKRRGTERTDEQGDMWWIAERDIREFVIQHPLRVDLAKIPAAFRAWFIELLAGRAGISVEQAA